MCALCARHASRKHSIHTKPRFSEPKQHPTNEMCFLLETSDFNGWAVDGWSLASSEILQWTLQSVRNICVQLGNLNCPDKPQMFQTLYGNYVIYFIYLFLLHNALQLHFLFSILSTLTCQNQTNKSQLHIRSSSHWVRCKQLGSPHPSWKPCRQA